MRAAVLAAAQRCGSCSSLWQHHKQRTQRFSYTMSSLQQRYVSQQQCVLYVHAYDLEYKWITCHGPYNYRRVPDQPWATHIVPRTCYISSNRSGKREYFATIAWLGRCTFVVLVGRPACLCTFVVQVVCFCRYQTLLAGSDTPDWTICAFHVCFDTQSFRYSGRL